MSCSVLPLLLPRSPLDLLVSPGTLRGVGTQSNLLSVIWVGEVCKPSRRDSFTNLIVRPNTMHPIVRYMILCEDWLAAPQHAPRVDIIGLLTNIHAVDEPPYPLVYRELCVFLILTEGRGQGIGRIVCAFEETGQVIFQTPDRFISFGPDPLEVVAIPFRIRDCPFPHPGMYSLEFWYDNEKIEACPLRLR
jgi:hypothetical protein